MGAQAGIALPPLPLDADERPEQDRQQQMRKGRVALEILGDDPAKPCHRRLAALRLDAAVTSGVR
jgi:hypothetical protein